MSLRLELASILPLLLEADRCREVDEEDLVRRRLLRVAVFEGIAAAPELEIRARFQLGRVGGLEERIAKSLLAEAAAGLHLEYLVLALEAGPEPCCAIRAPETQLIDAWD